MIGYSFRALTGRSALRRRLTKHFRGTPLQQIVTAARTFPTASRVDIQSALNDFFARKSAYQLVGIHSILGHESTGLAQLLSPSPIPTEIGPLQHDEIDIGEAEPVRCLKNGLWLATEARMPYAVLMGPSIQHGCPAGVLVEIAIPSGEAGSEFSQAFFRQVEIGVNAGRAYRGRVISLEQEQRFAGFGGTVKVHRLHKVTQDQVILPQKTLALLERNIHKFVSVRDQIKDRNQIGVHRSRPLFLLLLVHAEHALGHQKSAKNVHGGERQRDEPAPSCSSPPSKWLASANIFGWLGSCSPRS